MRSVVFGGHSPIALATCAALAQTGQYVTLVTRSADAELREAALSAGVNDLLEGDLAVPGVGERLLTGTDRGPLGALVFTHRYRGEANDSRQHEVEVRAPARLIEAAAQHKGSEPLAVVLTVSPAARLIVSDQPFAYHAAKAAQVQLVRHAAATLGAQGVRVNGVSPSAFVFKERARAHYEAHPELLARINRMVPLGRMASVDDIANVVAFLTTPASAYISGQIIEVDGGLSTLDIGTWARDIG
ncbi:MAG: SDR family oxidoreductase [Actinomycetales bacterium]|nr:SDR family oxidoreductase [Actinomycetales bacterium]